MNRIGRRIFLGAAASGLAGAARAQSTDVIRMAVGAAQVVTIDPIRLNQGVDNWAITNVHDLLARAPNGRFANTSAEFMPELAENWQSSPDGKTWSFKLRQGVQFHKGYGEATSEDVKFTFDRVRDPKSGSLYTPVFANMVEVVTDGPYTVRFNLKQPDPFFLASSIDQISAHIVCKKAVLERGEAYGRDPIGSGPYQIGNVQPKVVTLAGNDKYFAGPPVVPKLDIEYVLDSSARALALLGGAADSILAPSGPGAIPSIQARNPKLILDVVLPGNIWTLHFNLTRKPFDNVKVRQAFMYAIDRDKIARSQTPPTLRRYGMLPEPFPGALTATTTPPELRYDYDPNKARALLKEAGFPSGFAFSDFTSQRDDYLSLMLVVQEQLRQVGVNFDLKAIDHAAFHDQASKGLSSFTMRGTLYPPVPARPFLEELSAAADVTNTKGGQNYAHYGVAMPGIDDLLAKAMAEPDPARHIAIVQEMDRRVLTDLPVIPLCTTAYVYMHNPRLKLPFKVTAGTGFWRLDRASFAA